jgi:tRNA nucleotidyltransferase/poly(A) polymerase
MSYANRTAVSAERSRAELEKLLTRAGAKQFGVMTSEAVTHVVFELQNRMVRLTMKMPTLKEVRDLNKCSQERRRLWRVLVLVVKAKLEAVAQGLSDVEHEFLADVVVQGGETVGERLQGELDAMYRGEGRPQLLLSR